MAGAFHTAGLSAGGRMALKSLKLRQSSILPLHMVCGRTEGAECLCAGCGGRACLSPSLLLLFCMLRMRGRHEVAQYLVVSRFSEAQLATGSASKASRLKEYSRPPETELVLREGV